MLPPLEPIEITGSAILPAAPVRMDPVELTGSHFLAVTGELPILEAAPAAAASSAPSPRPSPPAGEREVDARPAPATPAPATIPVSTSIPTSIPIPIAIPAPTPAPAPAPAPISVPFAIPAPAPVPIAARIAPPAPLPTPVPFTPASMAEAEEEELVDLAADGVTVEDDAPPAPTPEELEHEHEVVDLATAALSVEDEEVIPPEAVEDELAHAAFLVANGFEDEARELLEALAAHHPGHDGVEALRRRLADGRSRVAPRAAPASALDGLFDPLDLPAPEPEPLTAEQVLAGIREGVAAAVPTGDWATRLDLALAYREMGLWSDAVGEYETALLGAPPERAAECLMGMAQCHAGQGRWADAAGLLERVLGIATLAPEASAAASYDLAVVRRSRGDVAGSARAFEAAERALPGFRDAGHQAARMRAEAGGAGGAGLLPDPSGA